jgi:glycosyltransferase involved in cell wall biosynthesis
MRAADRSVVHVLPHAGGGGETYVDVLREMHGYRFERVYVAGESKPGIGDVAAGILDLWRRVRGYDLVHVHGEAAAALLLPLLGSRPSVVTLHGLNLLRRVKGLRRRAATLNLHAVTRAAARTICVSNAEHAELAAALGQRGLEKVIVVHNGVHRPAADIAAARAAAREELGISETAALAIWVGSLEEPRDPLVVIRAAIQTSTALVMVGDGPLRRRAEYEARLPVQIAGDRNDVPRLLAAADFFVRMSAREGLSFALLEAMAQGLPPIVADVAENTEAIGDAGIAVPYSNEPALADAFRLLAGDSAERARLGERARGRVAASFNAADMIERTRALYDEVLAERNRRPRGSRSA